MSKGRESVENVPGSSLIYKSSTRHTAYEVFFIPLSSPIKLNFSKQNLGLKPSLDLDLTPRDLYYWNVSGFGDRDTFEQLGLPMEHKRTRDTKPIVSQENIAKVEGVYGKVAFVDGLLQFDLTLPVNNIYYFIYRVWAPELASITTRYPRIHLGDPIDGIRRLPQKYPVKSQKAERLLIQLDKKDV